MALRVRRLGRVDFDEAYDLQRALVRDEADWLLVLEHPPTVTLGRRADPSHVLRSPDELGARLIATDRGGDVTAHGPGQVVVYAIVTIDDDPAAIPAHAHRLEDAAIEVVEGLLGHSTTVGRLEGHPGVWVDVDGERPAKICALGIRTERVDGVKRTLHGIALNVDIDLRIFDTIVPCGIADRPVTSLAARGATVTTREVEDRLVEALARRLGPMFDDVSVHPVTIGEPDTGRMLERRLRAAGQDPSAALPLATRKPAWLRIPVRREDSFAATRSVVADLGLVTVCEEAGCPNIFECWSQGTATFMVNGERCTRACAFCLIDTRKPEALDASEPERVAEAVATMGLSHAVVTCVARDDLADGGAGAIAETIRAIRRRRPATTVEVLISDLKGRREDLGLIIDAKPDVLNHNLETVARLQRAIRPSAGYARSLGVLARSASAGLVTKSGLMVGLGETDDEIETALGDLAAVGVQIVTIGQYLRPTEAHAPVARYADPEVFDRLAATGRALGLAHVQSSPLTRSSYHAREAADAASAVPVTMRKVGAQG